MKNYTLFKEEHGFGTKRYSKNLRGGFVGKGRV